ncbi:MAG: hypothetical protein JW715_05330 [Sedimentisphaerales bacterium]|nr:hypothetical protein [Sedimentisphaerales bacterium]
MKRRKFIQNCFDCSLAAMVAGVSLECGTAYSRENEPAKEKESGMEKDPVKNELAHPMAPNQVTKLLKFIDANFDEPARKKIFGRLGYECFYSVGADKWIQNYKSDPDKFFEMVNSGKSVYWEKLEDDRENSRIRVISRKFVSCVCAFGQCPEPPKSLCNFCCLRLHKELFELLLGKKVEVKIDESIILGGERCRTTISIIN